MLKVPATRTLKRHQVGALPLLHAIVKRMGLRAVLERHVSSHGNDQVPVVDTLILLSYNLIIGKEPLYELPAWVASIDRRPLCLMSGLSGFRCGDSRMRVVLGFIRGGV